MKILIILAHPDKESFNHAIADTCRDRLVANGHSVIYHDLYNENFNPIINSNEIPKHTQIDKPIQKHCDDLINSDGIHYNSSELVGTASRNYERLDR